MHSIAIRRIGVLVLLVTLAVTSCGAPAPVLPTSLPATQMPGQPTSPPATQTAGQPTSPPGTQAPPVIRIAASSGAFGDNVLIALDEWAKANPTSTVQLTLFPHPQLREKVVTELATHSGTMDVVPVECPTWLADAAPFLEPLQPYIDASPDLKFDELLPPGIPWSHYPFKTGPVLTIPMRAGIDIIYYRKDLLDAAGLQPPKTLEDIVNVGLALKKPGFYPLTLHLNQDVYGVHAWMGVLEAMGGRVLNENLDKAVMGDKAVAATEWLRDLIYKYQLVPESNMTYKIQDVVTAMQKGNAAIGWFASANIFALDPAIAQKGGVIAYAEPPREPGVTGACCYWSFAFGISKDSKNKDAAWKLVQFLASNAAQVPMAVKAGNGPVRASVWQDPAVQKVNASALVALETMKYTAPRDPSPKWPQISDILASEISSALAGKKTSAQAVQDATNEINTLLGAK